MRLLSPWTDLALLASADGVSACREAERMWCEKLQAHAEAATTLMWGGSLGMVIAGYHAVVDANAARLAERSC